MSNTDSAGNLTVGKIAFGGLPRKIMSKEAYHLIDPEDPELKTAVMEFIQRKVDDKGFFDIQDSEELLEDIQRSL